MLKLFPQRLDQAGADFLVSDGTPSANFSVPFRSGSPQNSCKGSRNEFFGLRDPIVEPRVTSPEIVERFLSGIGVGDQQRAPDEYQNGSNRNRRPEQRYPTEYEQYTDEYIEELHRSFVRIA